MGPTGSGKSSFVDKVVRGGVGEGVGHDLTSYTSEVKSTRCMLEGSSVVLVDTPGFDDTSCSDLDILAMISHWLNVEYQKGTMLDAILYFHRISDNRMAGTPAKNLKVFEKLCGKAAMSKAILVTTMWDEVEDNVGKERLKELKDSYWRTMISRGSKTFEYKNTRNSATQLIRSIVHQETMRRGVQLQVEISDLEFELEETAAARELCNSLKDINARRMETLQRIRAAASAADQETSADLQRQYAEILAQLNSNLTQAQLLNQERPQGFLQRIRRLLTRNRQKRTGN
ncbi:P-loop containing nucleoside triphosphate hydrolase protein [Pisolithus marmoratus]|nr:P-loop containing nucleoside triphosphate hydrolase protein [Pisolithus marmoratus]